MPETIRKGLCAMIYQATEEVADRFDEAGLPYQIEETDGASIVHLSVDLEDTKIELLFISSDDDPDVSVRVFQFARFPVANMDSAIRAVNKLNCEYRHVAFTVDEEKHAINVRADLPLNTDNIGDIAFEMYHRVCAICKDVYPQLMHDIWS